MNNVEKKSITTQSLLQKLQESDPTRNVVFNAIDQLKKEEEIKQFYGEYIQSLKDSKENNPETIAQINIGYAIGYYSKETADKWMEILPNVSHPIAGRNIPFDKPINAFRSGLNTNKN